MKGRSTVDALYYFEYLVFIGFEKCVSKRCPTKVVGVFFDISKAFDSCIHARMLTYFETKYGLPEFLICVLKSYFSNRSQRVRVGGELSSSREVISGIGQGSILGPLLFIAYVNGVSELRLSAGAEILLYADDLVYVKPMDAPTAEAEMGRDIQAIADYFSSISLNLNNTKTRYMLFSVSPTPLNLASEPVVNGMQVERTDLYRYLGVELDPGLSYAVHTRHKVAKARAALGCLSRTVRGFVPQQKFRMLYLSLVRSVLLYAMPVCFPRFKRDIILLERTQKFACRLIVNNFDLRYNELLSITKLHSIIRTVVEYRFILIYKYVYNYRHVPPGVICVRNGCSRRTNHSKTIYIPNCKLESTNTSCFYQCARLWNFLSDDEISLDFIGFRNFVRSNALFERLLVSNSQPPLVISVDL